MERTLLIADFSNLVFRVGHGNSMGPYPMVRRALLRARDVVRLVGATDLAFVFDPDPTVSSRYAGDPEEARVPTARRILRDLGYPCYQGERSADDLMVALARRAEEAGFERIVVVSHDRDLVAAVSAKTSLIRPLGYGRFETWDAKRLAARSKVAPEAFADLRVLGSRPFSGSSHAIVDGKTSRALLARFGSIAGLYAHLDEVEPAALREHLAAEESYACERLAAIRTIEELPITLDVDGGRLGASITRTVDAGLEGLDRGSLLFGDDYPRIVTLGGRDRATESRIAPV